MSKKYQRAVGFFSSSALLEISKGIAGLIENGGTIELIASPKLSEEDVEAIEKGMVLREEMIAHRINEAMEEPADELEEKRLNLLTNLIAQKKLEIKIAILNKDNKIGIYHEKMGLLTDLEGNTVAFSGSMNESNTAFVHNCEVVDVFRSWESEAEAGRVSKKQQVFQNMWQNQVLGMEILDFPKASEQKLFQYRKDEEIDLTLDKEFEEVKETKW